MNLKSDKTSYKLVIMLMMIIIIASLMINFSSNASLKIKTKELESKSNFIAELENEKQKLNSALNLLNDMNTALQEEKDMLEIANRELHSQIEEMESRNYIIAPAKRDFKSYMSYKAITNTASAQYGLQQNATTNEDGIRCIDGVPMVAIGTGWGLWVGDRGLVTCENGNTFEIVVGDIKSDRHTDAENKTTLSNGCRCEFIVDTPYMNATARAMGSMAVLSKYSGYVVDIKKIN